MSATLHVLNGDDTYNAFERTSFDGDVMIWREVLSEGPVSANIEAATFWHERSAFICETSNETPQGYHDRIVVPLEKLSQPYEAINLWFDFDLHCQVNLLGVMMLLSQKTDLSGPSTYLICPAEVTDPDNFRGMGQLNGEQLESLYDNIRVQLSEYDFKLAAEAWALFVAGNAANLGDWLASTTFWANMHCLKPAMLAHFNRLQINVAGLNYIEQTLLDIYNSGIRHKTEIYHAFWNANPIYGMGDSELDIYLNSLASKGLITL